MTITGDIFMFLICLLAVIFTFNCHKNILYVMVSSMLWFVMFIWFFFSDAPILVVGEAWVDILAWCFLMLVFVPWIVGMNTEIKHEADGKSWKRWDTAPHPEDTPAIELYRDKLYNKTRRTKRKYK